MKKLLVCTLASALFALGCTNPTSAPTKKMGTGTPPPKSGMDTKKDEGKMELPKLGEEPKKEEPKKEEPKKKGGG